MSEGPRLWIGNVPRSVSEPEPLQALVGRFGTVTKVWIARNPPGFAFVVSAGRRRKRAPDALLRA